MAEPYDVEEGLEVGGTLANRPGGHNGAQYFADNVGTGAFYVYSGALDAWALIAERAAQNAQTGTTYTTLASDVRKTVSLDNASPVAVTLDNLAAGDSITFLQKGAGQVTFSGGGGITVQSPSGNLKLTGQYSQATVWAESATVYYLEGDLSA